MTRHIIRLCILLTIGILLPLGSCKSSPLHEPDDPSVDLHYMMGLYVNLGNRDKAKVRATPPDGFDYESGSGFENYIDLDDFNVYLFSTDNKLIAQLDTSETAEFTFSPVSGNNSSIYLLEFRIDKILDKAYKEPQSFKIVMLANWGAYPEYDTLIPGITTISDIIDGTSAIGEFTGNEDRIPFYGVQEYDNVTFTPGYTAIQEKELLLLRAFAKIDVCDDTRSSTPIKNVTLTRHNVKFYKAPSNVFHDSQYDDYYAPSLSLPTNPYEWESDRVLTLKKTDGHFVAYVPEYKNTERNAATRASLSVDYGNGNVFSIDFKYYSDPPEGCVINDPYDICRNYWYKFIVRRHETEVTLTTDVLPYHAIELHPIFGLD